MCFSPQASFGVAAILSVLGIAGLKKRKLSKISLIAVAPCFFGIQQALEGFVWITLHNGDTDSWLHYSATYGFLFFATVWWPLYIPIVLWYIEPNPKKKKQLLYPIMAGIVVVGVTAITIVYGGLYAEIVGHHIAYQSYTTFSYDYFLYYCGLIGYLIATTGAFFISSIRFAPIMGILTTIAFATAHIWYYYAFGSVWCFFAALCSGLILLAL